MPDLAENFAAAATQFEGRPFAHQGRGEAFDCLGLIAACYEAALGAFEIDWPDYKAPWVRAPHQGADHEFLAAVFEPHWPRAICRGDVLVFDLGKGRHWHFGIAASNQSFWHAHLRQGVVREELNAHWRSRLKKIYRISQVKHGNIGI